MSLYTKLPYVFLVLITINSLLFLVSCETSDLENRLDQRNESYQEYQDRRSMRRDARQERTDMWHDRVLGRSEPKPTGMTY